MCRRAPHLSLLLSSVAQPSAAPRSARATRPAPAARSAVAPTRRSRSDTVDTVPTQDYSDTNSASQDSVCVITATKVETGSPADKHCATSCARNSRRPRTLPQETCRKRGSGAIRREAAARSCTNAPWNAPDTRGFSPKTNQR